MCHAADVDVDHVFNHEQPWIDDRPRRKSFNDKFITFEFGINLNPPISYEYHFLGELVFFLEYLFLLQKYFFKLIHNFEHLKLGQVLQHWNVLEMLKKEESHWVVISIHQVVMETVFQTREADHDFGKAPI